MIQAFLGCGQFSEDFFDCGSTFFCDCNFLIGGLGSYGAFLHAYTSLGVVVEHDSEEVVVYVK